MTEFLSTRTKEWRENVEALSITTNLCIRFEDFYSNLEDGEMKAQMRDLYDNTLKDMLQHLLASTKYPNAYKFHYLRNFIYANWKYINQPVADYDNVFMPAFKHRVFGLSDSCLHHWGIDVETANEERAAGAEFDQYMQLLMHYYTNRLLNLKDGADRQPVSETSEAHDQLLREHRRLEGLGLYDEIYVVREMFMHLVWTAYGEFTDEAAARVFKIDAFEMLNEMNSRPVMVA